MTTARISPADIRRVCGGTADRKVAAIREAARHDAAPTAGEDEDEGHARR